jgi:hypothetical protein
MLITSHIGEVSLPGMALLLIKWGHHLG